MRRRTLRSLAVLHLLSCASHATFQFARVLGQFNDGEVFEASEGRR